MKMLLSSPWSPCFTQIDLKNAEITIKDGTGTPNSVTIKVGEGNLSWTEKKNRTYKLDRGELDDVVDGDEAPLDLKFDFVWEYLKSRTKTGATPTIEDALKKRGLASGWTSSDSDTCKPYAVDIVVVYTPSCSTGDKETITFPDFRWEQLDHDLRAGTISCSGKCNAEEPTIVRAAQ